MSYRDHLRAARAQNMVSTAKPLLAQPRIGGSLVELIEKKVGPLHRCRSGRYEGACPFHGSESGRCLAIDDHGKVWYCHHCKRGGDAVAWVMLTRGVSRAMARAMLGLVDPAAIFRLTLREHERRQRRRSR